MGDRGPYYNWKEMDKFFSGRIPFMPKEFQERLQMDSSWIGDYVQDVLKHSFSDSAQNMNWESKSFSRIEYDLFETHNSVIVRLRIPENIHPKHIKLFVGSNRLKVENLSTKQKQMITLPNTIDAEGSRAVFKDNVMEVRMPKANDSDFFNEIKIRY